MMRHLRRKTAVIAAVALATAIAAVAGILVIFPITLEVTETGSPVYFEQGTNAGATGLNRTTIDVTVGANKTSATVSFYVTYQTNYIVNVLKITNGDTSGTTYYAKLCVATPLDSDVIAAAEAIVTDSAGTRVATVDLTTTGCSGEFTIAAGASYNVHFMLELTEGRQLDTGTLTAELELHWSPETPVPSAP